MNSKNQMTRKIKWLLLFIVCFVSCNFRGKPTSYIIPIRLDVYDIEMVIVISENIPAVANYISTLQHDSTITFKSFMAKGVTFRNENIDIMWLPRVPATAEDRGVAAHEIFHLARGVMDYVNIPLGDDSEEAYAYVISSITQQFYQHIKGDE